jgi:peptidoglycan hydrolase CwlO-like protein
MEAEGEKVKKKIKEKEEEGKRKIEELKTDGKKLDKSLKSIAKEEKKLTQLLSNNLQVAALIRQTLNG